MAKKKNKNQSDIRPLLLVLLLLIFALLLLTQQSNIQANAYQLLGGAAVSPVTVTSKSKITLPVTHKVSPPKTVLKK